LPFRTKATTGAVGLGLVLVLILVLLPSGGGEKGVLLVEKPVSAAQGGSIASSDGKIALEIPPGALTEDTTVSIRVLSKEEWTDDIKDLNPVGPVSFQEPVTLKLAMDSSLYSLGPDGIEVTVPLLYTTGGNALPEPLSELEIVVSPDEAYIQGTTTHFSQTWESAGTVILAMDPEEIKLSACAADFVVNFGVINASAVQIEAAGGKLGKNPTNVTDSSWRPVAKPAVTVVNKGVAEPTLWDLAPGKEWNDVFTYHITDGEGSYGVRTGL
jgi:hypothetical protein